MNEEIEDRQHVKEADTFEVINNLLSETEKSREEYLETRRKLGEIFVTASQAQEMLCISKNSVCVLVRDGKLTPIIKEVGQATIFLKSDIIQLLNIPRYGEEAKIRRALEKTLKALSKSNNEK